MSVGDVFAVDDDRAAVGLHEAGDHLEEHALARGAGADEAVEAAFGDVESHVARGRRAVRARRSCGNDLESAARSRSRLRRSRCFALAVSARSAREARVEHERRRRRGRATSTTSPTERALKRAHRAARDGDGPDVRELGSTRAGGGAARGTMTTATSARREPGDAAGDEALHRLGREGRRRPAVLEKHARGRLRRRRRRGADRARGGSGERAPRGRRRCSRGCARDRPRARRRAARARRPGSGRARLCPSRRGRRAGLRRGSSSSRIAASARAASSRGTSTRNFPSASGSTSFVASMFARSSATTMRLASSSSSARRDRHRAPGDERERRSGAEWAERRTNSIAKGWTSWRGCPRW